MKGLNTGSSDLSDTIQSIRDDEIRDTFDVDDVDSENVETPPMQRRGMPAGAGAGAGRNKSFRYQC